MNRISIHDLNIDVNIDDSIIFKDLSDENSFIKRYSLDILNDSLLEFEYNIEENIKVNVIINVHDDVVFTLLEKKNGNEYKIKYDYKLGKNSNVSINKLNDINKIKESNVFNLNGENSKLEFILKTISKNHEIYDIIVNHNSKRTTSKVMNNGINIDSGHLTFNVNGFVPNGCIETDVMQDNHIINLTNHKCQINPNLFIDEENVSANHSAHICDFNKEDLFYIQSRGINKNEATKLLVKGFMNKDLNDYYKEIIDDLVNKYWG